MTEIQTTTSQLGTTPPPSEEPKPETDPYNMGCIAGKGKKGLHTNPFDSGTQKEQHGKWDRGYRRNAPPN
jgi:hypothetical protein